MEPRPRPTEEDGKVALRDHVRVKAWEARQRHPDLEDPDALEAYLSDGECVRFPTSLVFDAAELEAGEFAWAQPLGEHPRDGYRLHVHPSFRTRPDVVPRLVAYHVARINYGDIVTPEEAELYGATLLGLDQEDYYRSLCRAADGLG